MSGVRVTRSANVVLPQKVALLECCWLAGEVGFKVRRSSLRQRVT